MTSEWRPTNEEVEVEERRAAAWDAYHQRRNQMIKDKPKLRQEYKDLPEWVKPLIDGLWSSIGLSHGRDLGNATSAEIVFITRAEAHDFAEAVNNIWAIKEVLQND